VLQRRQAPPVSVSNQGIELRAVEFFAGIGLVRLGLERQGWKVVFANEVNPSKGEMYACNFERSNLTLDDIASLRGTDVPSCLLATASFPCTDLSIAGGKVGISGPQSATFWEFTRLLNEMGERKPPLLLIENVDHLLKLHGGTDLRTLLLTLNDLGYACDVFILDAKSFAAQSRRRLFVVGKKPHGEHSSKAWPAAMGGPRPDELVSFINLNPDIKWDIRDLCSAPDEDHSLASVLEDMSDGDPSWYPDRRLNKLLQQLSDRHAEVVQEMSRRPDFTYVTVFRRVRNGATMAEIRTDGLAGCLRTTGGGSSRQELLRAGRGNIKARLLTPRECARLQGVPDSFVINLPQDKALSAFGDAVCVPVIEWIAGHYLNPVAHELLASRAADRQATANGAAHHVVATSS
jgi:DNA (cytosine-5)-methyltransferase 1